MDISFKCSKCGQSLVIDEVGAGNSLDCPKCGSPVYVPNRTGPQPQEAATRLSVSSSRPAASNPLLPPSRQAVIPATEIKESDQEHPAIIGSLHCLIILVALGVIGCFAFHQNIFAGMVFLYMAVPFVPVQILCATYGICKGHVKDGLLLIGGISVLIGLFAWIVFASLPGAAIRTNADTQRQMQEMQQQIQKQMQQFSR